MLYSLLVIDWFSVFFNSFWIVGLAILLSAFSYHQWLAGQENRRLKEQLAQPGFQKFFWLSLVLIAIGLAGTSQKSWEVAIWIIFALMSIVNMVQAR